MEMENTCVEILTSKCVFHDRNLDARPPSGPPPRNLALEIEKRKCLSFSLDAYPDTAATVLNITQHRKDRRCFGSLDFSLLQTRQVLSLCLPTRPIYSRLVWHLWGI
jgi:hypothetical protein